MVKQWRGPLSRGLLSETTYLLVEGAIRSAKTTMGLWKIHDTCINHPGSKCWIARWTDDDTQVLLKPLWVEILEESGTVYEWRADEHAYYIPATGSLVYVHGIRPSENKGKYSKFRGKTLAKILIDQAEELPEDYWPELQGRLSQKDQPHQIILTPNAVNRSHWIAQVWPIEGTFGDYEYIRVRVYDNRNNLPDGYIAQLERTFPPDDPKRRTMLLGLRGLSVAGRAVYGGYFDRARHVGPVSMNPQLPLLEALDFGFHHPAVLWAQMTPHGGIDILGGLQGRDLSLEEFAPILLGYRTQWFPHPLDVQMTCDPSGNVTNAGIQTAVQYLNTLGIYPRVFEHANEPTVRATCIEVLQGTMRRRTALGEAFRVSPERWGYIERGSFTPISFFLDGLEGGYVWDPHPKQHAHKPIRVPLKDGEYDHLQNCLEYLQVAFGRAHPTEKQLEAQADAAYHRAIHRVQRDVDEADVLYQRTRLSRGGYR